MEDFIIRVEGLNKTFNQKMVIQQCSMKVKKGVIYGLLGPNGAGKTTLFKLMTGLLKPTAGSIEIMGLDSISGRNEILKHTGFVIDTPTFYMHLSAKENLKIHLSYMGMDSGNIDEYLHLVGLKDTGSQPISEFSLGMKQRLAIARAIIHNPSLLLLDEPINGLDPFGIREMRILFRKLVDDKGITIVISSHILNEIEFLADMIGIIQNGRIINEIPISSVNKSHPNGLEDYFFDAMKEGKNHV